MSRYTHEIGTSAALANGNVEAFDSLYKQYRGAIYSNILKLVKSPEYAEDILQEVFVSLWQNRYRMRANQSVSGWLFVVSYNKSLTFLKQKVRASIDYVESYQSYEHVIPEETVDESAYIAQLHMIEEAVEALPRRKKEVFKLYRFEGKSKEEVASLVGISTDSVKDYLKQSNKAIKDYIDSRYPYAPSELALLLALMMQYA